MAKKKKVEQKIIVVADLIAKLETFPMHLPVGTMGHFGEYHKIEIDDIRISKIMLEYPESKNRKDKDFECVCFPIIDIGPEPD